MSSDTYMAKARRIWDELVPASGCAETVQGELVRVVEKLRDEAHRNGNVNWDARHDGMLRFLEQRLLDEAIFDSETRRRTSAVLGRLSESERPDTADAPYDMLLARAVDWSEAQSDLVPMPAVEAMDADGVTGVIGRPTPEPSALLEAVRRRDAERVKQLVASGVDVDQPESEYQRTPLFIAAVRGHVDMIELLLELGANLHAVDGMGLSVLDMAVHKNEARAFLKARGARSAKTDEV